MLAMNQPPGSSGRLLLLLWAIAATLVAAVSTVISVHLFLRLRSAGADHAALPAATFSALRDDAVAGRYKWIEAGEDRGVITLLPDHSFIPPNGGRMPAHQWKIGRDALLVVWLSGIDRFTNIESPGVYVATRPDGRILRMEKMQ
jgi:hypothetical protein